MKVIETIAWQWVFLAKTSELEDIRMFFKKEKKRKDVVLSQSTLVAYEAIKDVMAFVYKDAEFVIKYGTLKFPEEPSNPKTALVVEGIVAVYAKGYGLCIEPTINLILFDDQERGWRTSNQRIILWFWDYEPFNLEIAKEGGFAPITSVDAAKLATVQERLQSLV